jgi:hypothetical protein
MCGLFKAFGVADYIIINYLIPQLTLEKSLSMLKEAFEMNLKQSHPSLIQACFYECCLIYCGRHFQKLAIDPNVFKQRKFSKVLLRDLLIKAVMQVSDTANIKDMLLILKKCEVCKSVIDLMKHESAMFETCNAVHIQEINVTPALEHTLDST